LLAGPVAQSKEKPHPRGARIIGRQVLNQKKLKRALGRARRGAERPQGQAGALMSEDLADRPQSDAGPHQENIKGPGENDPQPEGPASADRRGPPTPPNSHRLPRNKRGPRQEKPRKLAKQNQRRMKRGIPRTARLRTKKGKDEKNQQVATRGDQSP